jgi:hypothetical protein
VGLTNVAGPIRARTLQLPSDRLTRKEAADLEPYPEWADRPRRRADCENEARPCPFVSCRYHLYLDVAPSGNIKLNHPGLEVWDMAQTCALDVADFNPEGLPLEEVGDLMNLTRERCRQIEFAAVGKIRNAVPRKDAA